MAEYTEDCCFNYPRDYCKGAARCSCGCHEAKRVTRREWETIKVADFERLEAALQQIIWLADAAEPLSVKAAEIARAALERRQPAQLPASTEE